MWNLLKRIGLLFCAFSVFSLFPVYGQDQGSELRNILLTLETELLNSKALLQNQRLTLANLKKSELASDRTLSLLKKDIVSLKTHITSLEDTITSLNLELTNSKEATSEALNSLDEASKSLRNQRLAIAGISAVAITFLSTTLYLALK